MHMGGGAGKTTTVCVTGAGGFVASWLVRLLLSRGHYVVHGTVRDPTVCVSSWPGTEVLAPAVTGTQNVLRACHEAMSVRRVVVVSSVAAVIMNPEVPDGAVVDEDCWSDVDYCRTTEMWYCLSKTLVERAALAYAAKVGMDVVTVCPPLVLGPLLQSTVNTSSLRLLNYLKCDTAEEKTRNVVDVRDVADALVLAYETPEASGRRFICSAYAMKVSETLAVIRSVRPDLKLDYTTKKFVQVEDEKVVSSKRLQALGWKFRKMEETLRDTVGSYEAAGILN
ncbi:hypothetical protein PR202_gb27931 [Eleusine coracana subsp. coracana]|uniref:NAD-dependent epimerase/dehydratase domain-containing protein n=1 Tax=Eleusine coracana subsp. coracana TaxID=191504 RepID=A0AAV5FVH2_ELECO|nr:hypothetical protein PR202_gb27931 [Eleusine coracana subsp. coracana]